MMRMVPFHDRTEAGRELAARLTRYAQRPDVLLLGLPRGGVAVAAEVGSLLHVPLDILLVRKLGVPGREELALGAMATGGVLVFNRQIVEASGIPPENLEAVITRTQRDLLRRERHYRGHCRQPQVGGNIAILVDDGAATGATMRAAIVALRRQHPSRLVVAVPIAPPPVCEALQAEVEELVCLLAPDDFSSVGDWY